MSGVRAWYKFQVDRPPTSLFSNVIAATPLLLGFTMWSTSDPALMRWAGALTYAIAKNLSLRWLVLASIPLLVFQSYSGSNSLRDVDLTTSQLFIVLFFGSIPAVRVVLFWICVKISFDRYSHVTTVTVVVLASVAFELVIQSVPVLYAVCHGSLHWIDTLGGELAVRYCPVWIAVVSLGQWMLFRIQTVRHPSLAILTCILVALHLPVNITSSEAIGAGTHFPSIVCAQGCETITHEGRIRIHPDHEDKILELCRVSHSSLVVFGEGMSQLDVEDRSAVRVPLGYPRLLVCSNLTTRKLEEKAGIAISRTAEHVGSWIVSQSTIDCVRIKTFLVPLFETEFHGFGLQSLSPGPWQPNYSTVLFNVHLCDISIRICFEACFADSKSGPAYTQSSSKPAFHLVQAGNAWIEYDSYLWKLFRLNLRRAAIIQNSWVVVVCSSHSSMIIDPNGEVREILLPGFQIMVFP
jgi:hypothetical protein